MLFISPHFRRAILIFSAAAFGSLAGSLQAGRMDLQLVHDYMSLVENAPPTPQPLAAASPRINPFLSYTNIGTDFGFLGPTPDAISWEPGAICLGFGVKEWGGVWHSLAGRATDTEAMDFQRPYPSVIEPKFQPTVTALRLKVKGKGIFAVELKAADQLVLWQRRWELTDAAPQELRSTLENTPPAKLLNWVAQAGTELCVDSLAFEVVMPDMPMEQEMLLRCYAKLARCYSTSDGLVRDRAHLEAGVFDNTPVSGLFCLAAAAATQQGFTSVEDAKAILRRTAGIFAAIPSREGIFPHFLKTVSGSPRIHPGTEFSVVDTAIYYQAMLTAAEILGETSIASQLTDALVKIDFTRFRDPQGRVYHGFMENGEHISSVWQDWGAETAMVLLFQRMGMDPGLSANMNTDGAIFRDCGFIPEIASIIFPQFDRDQPDLVTQQSWGTLRRGLYTRQKAYFTSANSVLPSSIFGLSAGEGRFGDNYLVSGTQLPEQRTIHPHYLFLSWASAPSTADWFQTLDQLNKRGYFPPWGCVENIDAPTGASLPMIGSLNAAFEFLSTYHAHQKHVGKPDVIYDAVQKQPLLKTAMQLFYPQ